MSEEATSSSSNPPNENMVLSGLEKLLERQLAASSGARSRLTRLNGRSFALEISGINLNVYVHCVDDTIRLRSEHDENAEPDVIITGSPMAMLNFARAQQQDAFRGGGVKFSGDVGVAQDFQALFNTLSPDFEEELSRLIGDEAAYRVSKTVRDLFSWGKSSLDSLSVGVASHLTEGSKDVPSNEEMNDFLEDVDSIRADIDRAEARVERLKTQTTQQDQH